MALFLHADRPIKVLFHIRKLTALVPVERLFNFHGASQTKRRANMTQRKVRVEKRVDNFLHFTEDSFWLRCYIKSAAATKVKSHPSFRGSGVNIGKQNHNMKRTDCQNEEVKSLLLHDHRG